MRQSAILLTLVLAMLGTPGAADAQQPSKTPRIGVLSPLSPSADGPNVKALREGLRELGYVDGQNIVLDYRWAEGQLDQLPDLMAELLRFKPDVIVTSGAPAALAAKRATPDIPVVMAQINDPVGLGLVASLAKPGGNFTGLANLHTDMAGKQLELLKEVVPKLSVVAVLWNPANRGAELIVRHVRHATRALGAAFEAVEVRDPAELESAFAAMKRQRASALLVPPDPFFLPHGKQIVGLAARHRLPAVYGWREFVEAGGLMAYGPSVRDMFRRSAAYVDKILKGTRPSDLPVEQPTRFELVINLKTAQALRLTLPQSLLVRADQVIQ